MMRRRSLLALTLLPMHAAWPAGPAPKEIHVSTLIGGEAVAAAAEAILAAAYLRLGIRLVVHRLPGERALLEANNGTRDGELYRQQGMERDYPNLVQVPVPILTSEIVVFTRGLKFPLAGWESLRPYTIGYVQGVKSVQQGVRGMRAEPVTTMERAFQKLMLGRTDVVVANRSAGTEVVAALALKQVEVLAPPLLSFPLFHYLNRKHAALVPQLTLALRR